MLFVAIILLLSILYGYYWFSKIVESVSHIPGPRKSWFPFVGNAFMLLRLKPSELNNVGIKLVKKYGLFTRFLLGPIVLIIICDPKDVEALLVDHRLLEKSQEYEITRVWIGTGLLTAPSAKWTKRRKVITPGFHYRCLQEYAKVFDKNSEILVSKMKKLSGETFDVLPLVQLCALDNVCGI